jgi:isochorismate synthase
MSGLVEHRHGAEPARAEPAERGLVHDYREESPFFFASAQHTLLGQAEGAERLSLTASERLADDLSARLHQLGRLGAVRPIAAGALPFDSAATRAPFWLFRECQSAAGRCVRGLDLAERGPLATACGYGVRLSPSAFAYVAAVEEAGRRIARGELSKVVLSRALELSLEQPISRALLLRRLLLQNRGGFAFALDVGASASDARVLIGVSPELLLQKRGQHVFTNPLAGSRPRGRERAEDEALASELLSSRKDLHEHRLVVEAVIEALRPWCSALTIPEGPSLVSTPSMWHLSSAISGELRDRGCSSLALAQALHPTPAVCGQPRAQAERAIHQLEGFERGLFAGAVGYCDSEGDGEWAVSLRCAELTPHTVRVFAGAGIVAGSEPWSEFDETSAKMGTMLRALGVGLIQVSA